MADDERSDKNLAQFKARAKNPTSWGQLKPAPVQVFIMFDQGFGNQSADYSSRFRYVGTSPQVSQYEQMCARRKWWGGCA